MKNPYLSTDPIKKSHLPSLEFGILFDALTYLHILQDFFINIDTAESPTKMYTIFTSIGHAPKRTSTRFQLKRPTSPQLSPPTSKSHQATQCTPHFSPFMNIRKK